ncbi:MAG TPA: 50S ribosomal protein L9 [Gammaproteobacteria bacterium]|nr:50S ribosomal protein L9 [Gammaproteobacteria bacterium]
MEVILLNKVSNLGNLGDKVKVKNGYARNFLIPSGKAKPATPENIKEFEARRAELEKLADQALGSASEHKQKIDALGSITIRAKAGGEGKLFGSVGTFDIVEAVKAAGVDLEKRNVRLPAGNLRDIGEYEIGIHLHTDVETKLKVIIVAEE